MFAVKSEKKGFEARLEERLSAFAEGNLNWIYENDIEEDWERWLAENDRTEQGSWTRRVESGISPNL
jgi:hypothetical protein